MNIFVLDKNPVTAAQLQCDKHIVKMILESAQLLCNSIPQEISPYKHTHVKHPCSLWAKRSLGNFLWLYDHAIALSSEYTKRYKKIHKSLKVILLTGDVMLNSEHKEYDMTSFALAMPDEFKTECSVLSYRNYYKFKRSEWIKKGSDMKYTNSLMPDWLQLND